jgi:AcrR family transcriptional regulator
MLATAAELGRVGYAALRVEDVAAEAGVNKTTIYRRWPNKAELVAAALRAVNEPSADPPDRGRVDLDLLELLQEKVARASTCEGQSIHRMIIQEMDHPEVASITQSLRAEFRAPWIAVIERAVARGELPEGSDPELMTDMIMGSVFQKLLRQRADVDAAYLARVVDMVVLGAKSGGAVRSPTAPAPAPPLR